MAELDQQIGKNLKNLGLTISMGSLNFLANVGLMLPYILILAAYHESTENNFLIALIIFYIARAASIFYTKRFNLTSMTYLMISVAFGAIGSFIYASTTNLYWLAVASLLWGYSAAIIWPYFLTVKLHITKSNQSLIKRVHWLVFAILGLIFGLDILTKTAYTFSFIFLGLLYLCALPSCLLLNNLVNDFHRRDSPLKQRHFARIWRTGLFVVFFGILAVLTTLRKVAFTVATGWLWLLLGLGFVILSVELYADRKIVARYKTELLNRGFLTGYILLFNGFLAQFILGTTGMYVVFAVYLIGFELGHPLFNQLAKKTKWPALKFGQISLMIGHVCLLVPTSVTYILGLLALTLYVGYDNPELNQKLYAAEAGSDRAIVNKYRFSTYGGLFCQLIFFTLLIFVSGHYQLALLDFFTPTTLSHGQLYFYSIGWPMTLISLGLSIRNIRTMKAGI